MSAAAPPLDGSGASPRPEGGAPAPSACLDVSSHQAGIPPVQLAAGTALPAAAFSGMDRSADIALTLPLPPSANRMWRHARGVIHKSEDYKAWLYDAGWSCIEQRHGDSVPRLYALRIVLPKTRMDPDNLIKPTNDLLVASGAVTDDRHARRILLEVDEAREAGSMLVELWALPDPPKPPRKRKAVA